MDKLTPEHRSWNMSRIRSKNTKPELIVRSLLHRMGYRFRLHKKDMPGKPDIVLSKYKMVIFVHGCFWHRHKECKEGKYFPKDPKQGVEFLRDKFEMTVQRDKKNRRLLNDMGWAVNVIWQCQTKNKSILEKQINKIFDLKRC